MKYIIDPKDTLRGPLKYKWVNDYTIEKAISLLDDVHTIEVYELKYSPSFDINIQWVFYTMLNPTCCK